MLERALLAGDVPRALRIVRGGGQPEAPPAEDEVAQARAKRVR